MTPRSAAPTRPTGKGRAISRSPISASPPRHRHGLGAAFGYAFAGLRTAWRTQRNVRIHAALALLVLFAGALLRLGPLEWALIVLAIALVGTAELLNTALEALVDLVSPGEHPLAKHAKDVAAAAVLIASLGALAIGALVLWERLAWR